MWGQPREGTEAYNIQKEVERRKKIAKDKGLDQFLIDVYHDSIKYFPSWIKNQNKKYVHPKITGATEMKEGGIEGVEFNFDNKKYKITRGNQWVPEFSDDNGTWYDISLYIDNKKIFEVSEEETFGQYCNFHRPISIKAFVNEDWVDDIKQIQEYGKQISKQVEIEFAEDPKKTKELKEAFGIEKIEINNNTIKAIESENQKQSKWWVWLIIIIIGLILINS